MPVIPIVASRRAERADRWLLAFESAVIAAVVVPVFVIVPIRVLLQVWLIPGVVVGYISAVRALAQHALTRADDPLLASRSVRSNRLVAFLLLNENYHLEHHLFPEVPSYNLPRLPALLNPSLPRAIEPASQTPTSSAKAGTRSHPHGRSSEEPSRERGSESATSFSIAISVVSCMQRSEPAAISAPTSPWAESWRKDCSARFIDGAGPRTD